MHLLRYWKTNWKELSDAKIKILCKMKDCLVEDQQDNTISCNGVVQNSARMQQGVTDDKWIIRLNSNL